MAIFAHRHTIANLIAVALATGLVIIFPTATVIFSGVITTVSRATPFATAAVVIISVVLAYIFSLIALIVGIFFFRLIAIIFQIFITMTTKTDAVDNLLYSFEMERKRVQSSNAPKFAARRIALYYKSVFLDDIPTYQLEICRRRIGTHDYLRIQREWTGINESELRLMLTEQALFMSNSLLRIDRTSRHHRAVFDIDEFQIFLTEDNLHWGSLAIVLEHDSVECV
jgi:hypothetical protein